MKKIFIISLLFLSAALNAVNRYVSPTGSDGAAGTVGAPWLTPQYAFNAISAGDTLIVRGGTYLLSATTSHSWYCGVSIDGKHGTSGSKYNVKNYPGETPVFDCRNMTGTSYGRIGILLYSANYWSIKGINVTRADQSSGPVHGGTGIRLEGGNHIVIENCSSYVNGGPGYMTRTPDGEGNTFINSDAHDNYDAYSTDPIGGDADGFDIGYSVGDYTITLIGCRTWNNSDDGFDMYNNKDYGSYTGIYVLINCWAWHNGYRSDQVTTAGDGCGFKIGLDNNTYSSTFKRFMYNCIAYDNRMRGFSQESANVRKKMFNNISYGNHSYGFSFGWSGDASDIETGDSLKSNVAFGDGIQSLHGSIVRATRISVKNSWDAGAPAVSSADFVSVDGTQLAGARASSGALPVMTFLHLASASDLIGAGSYTGTNPTDGDLVAYLNPPAQGAYQYIVPGGGDVAPTVLTVSISNKTATSATSGGNITDDGGASVTARGVCWGSSANPTVSGSHTTDGTGAGVFSSSITGLTKATPYHVRAYATNSEGTSYGADVLFRTPGGYKVVY